MADPQSPARPAAATADDGPLVTSSGLSWATGAVAPAFILGVFSYILFYYLVYQVKISPGLAGTLIFISRMADMVFAPLIGLGSDHTHSRWGRRRPFMFAAGVLTPVSWLILLIIPVTGVAAAIWAMVGLLMISGCYSLFNIPHVAMANEITDYAPARVRLMSVRMVFGMIAGLLGSLLPKVIEMAPGQKGYTIIAVLMAVGCGGPMLVAAIGARQTLPRDPSPPIKFKEMFSGLTNNTPFIVITVGRLASLLLGAGQNPIMPFFLGIVMKMPIGNLATFLISANVIAIISQPLWVKLIRRFGMQLIRDLTVILGIIFCLSFLFVRPHEPVIGLLIRALVYGCIIGSWQLVANTMQADVIDYDYRLTGRRREGLFAAFFSFADKTAAALGLLGVGVMMSAVGFDKTLPKTQDQGPHVMMGLYLAMAILPALAYVITFIAYRFYKLDPGRGIYPEGSEPPPLSVVDTESPNDSPVTPRM